MMLDPKEARIQSAVKRLQDDPNDRDAWETIEHSYRRLVYMFAGRYYNKMKRESVDYLAHIGRIGLWSAVQTFDPNRGAKFITHAVVHIRGGILRHLVKEPPYPFSIGCETQDTRRRVLRWMEDQERIRGVAPSVEEAASEFGETIERVESFLRLQQFHKVDLEETFEVEDAEAAVSFQRFTDRLDRELLVEKILAAMEGLPDQTKQIIWEHDVEKKSFRTIGRGLGISESLAHSLYSPAISEIQQRLGVSPGNKLVDYERDIADRVAARKEDGWSDERLAEFFEVGRGRIRGILQRRKRAAAA